jgi:hypothetical protein
MVHHTVQKHMQTKALVFTCWCNIKCTGGCTGRLKYAFYSSLFLSCRVYGTCFFVGVESSYRLTWFSITVCWWFLW